MAEGAAERELTRGEAEALHRRILALSADRERQRWALGRALTDLLLLHGYRQLGFATFEEYLEGPLGLHRATGYRYVRLHAIYGGVAAALPEIDAHRLDILHHLFRPGDPPDEIVALVQQAAALPLDRLRLAAHREARRREETPPARYRLPARLD